jgi:hypothetical protein
MNADVGPAYANAEKEAEEISALFNGIAGGIVLGQLGALWVKHVLDERVTTDEYVGAEETSILQSRNAVRNATPDTLETSQGVTRDDSQPYPVLGWVELEWVSISIIAKQP